MRVIAFDAHRLMLGDELADRPRLARDCAKAGRRRQPNLSDPRRFPAGDSTGGPAGTT